jgi:hypothetical protein
MATNKGRRIVDALDDLRAELRLANQIEVLRAGASFLDHDKGARATTDTAKARLARQNQLRADIRAGLSIEQEQGS